MYLSPTPKIALALVLLSLCLGSCGEVFTSLPEAPDPNAAFESAAVTIYLTRPGQADFAARTLVPQDAQDRYVRLTFEQEGSEPVEAATTGESVIVPLAPGTWNISAQGWHSQGDYETTPDVVVLKGQGRAEVTADEVKDAWVVLYPTGTGTGLLSYTVQVPGDTVSAFLRVYALPETADSPSYLLDLFEEKETGADGLTLKGELSLNTGFYRAALDISRGAAGVLRKNDTVHIYDTLATQGTYVFSVGDFSPAADTFASLEALQTYTTGLPANTPDTPYLITLNMNISGLSKDGDSLGGLFAALNGRYVALDLRTCAVGDETAITGIPRNASNPRNGEYLVSLFLPEGIIALGEYAFYLCPSLEYLSLPQTLTAIGNWALRETAVRSLSVPQGVKSLGEGAFGGMTRLQNLDLSGLTLESMGDRILASCPNLEQVILPENLPGKTLPNNTFGGSAVLESVNLPRDLETIGIGAFSGCAALSDADLPPSLKTINQQAFSGCSVFTPDIGSLTALETLGNMAFFACTELKTLSLPTSIKTLEARAFQSCENLTLAEIPESLVDLIDQTTFLYCRKLQFKVDAQEPTPLLIDGGLLRAYPGAVGAVSLPEGIKEIPAGCFQQDTGITAISLPASLETIGNGAFHSCTNLVSVSIPADAQLKTIFFQAFYGCTKLAAIDLPVSLASIGDFVFYGTTLLESVICRAPTPPTLGNYVFDRTYGNYGDLKIYVPDTSLDTYKAAANWQNLSDRIYGLSSL
jgi:hypothetical protein